jgi:hypothetical protein
MLKIKAKKATRIHSKFLFDLRNEKICRKNSFFQKKILWPNHAKWFDNILKNKKNIYYIYKLGSFHVGFVRLQNIYENTYEVSIACKKKYQDKGIGSVMLNDCEKKIKINSILFAKVKRGNKKSEKIFDNLHYSLLVKKTNYKLFFKIINVRKHNVENVIKNIEINRKNNNLNWMELLKVSFLNNPWETRKIFQKIYKSDKVINNLSKKLL